MRKVAVQLRTLLFSWDTTKLFYILKELKILDKSIGVNCSRETSHFRVTGQQRLHNGDFSLKTTDFQPFASHFDQIWLKNTRFVSYFDVLDNPRAKVWFHTRQHIVWDIQAQKLWVLNLNRSQSEILYHISGRCGRKDNKNTCFRVKIYFCAFFAGL